MKLNLLTSQEGVHRLWVPADGATKPNRLRETGSFRPTPPGGTADLVLCAELGSGGASTWDGQIWYIGIAGGGLCHLRYLQRLEKPRGSFCRPPEPANRSCGGKSSETVHLYRTPVLRIIPAGTTVRPWIDRNNVPIRITSKPVSSASPLGVVCWPSWYAEDVGSVFPDQASTLVASGLFFVRNSAVSILTAKKPSRYFTCIKYYSGVFRAPQMLPVALGKSQQFSTAIICYLLIT